MNYQLLSWLKETFIGDEMEDTLLLQDFILPLQHVKEALLLNQAISAIYPVWLVPARGTEPWILSLYSWNWTFGKVFTITEKG